MPQVVWGQPVRGARTAGSGRCPGWARAGPPHNHPQVSAVLALQRTCGNRAVSRLLQRCAECAKTHNYNGSDLTWDPDKEARLAANDPEVRAGQELNAQNPGLNLWRPPGSGQGDFVARGGTGHHIDHKGLYGSGTSVADTYDALLTKSTKAGLPVYMLIDTGAVAASHGVASCDQAAVDALQTLTDNGGHITKSNGEQKDVPALPADIRARTFFGGPLRPRGVPAPPVGQEYVLAGPVATALIQEAPAIDNSDFGLGLFEATA